MKRFYLYHTDLQQPVKIAAPVGWDGLNKTIRRDRTLHGVFFDYTPRLKFVKDGKAIIHNLYEQYGPEAEIILVIMERNEVSRVWEKEYEGRLNLLSFKVSEIYAECNVESTGFRQRFVNAQEVRFPLAGSVDLTLHSKVLFKRIEDSGEKFEAPGVMSDGDVRYMMFNVTPAISEIIDFFDYGTQVSDLDPTGVDKYVIVAKEAGTYTLRVRLNYQIEMDDAAFQRMNVIWKLVIGTEVITLQNATVDFNVALKSFPAVDLTYTRTIAVNTQIYLYATVTLPIGGTNDGFIFKPFNSTNKCLFDVDAFTVGTDSISKSELVFEALDKVVENMVGSPARLRSSFYGRTDSSRVYASDGPGSLKAVTSGLNIRGKEVLTANWKDLFKTLQVVDNVGCGIRKEGTIEVVDVEHFSHFYAPRQVLRLDYVSDLAKEVDETLYHNEVETGYSKWANEKISNLDEFNSKREWQLPVTQAKKRMNLVAPYVASGYTIEFLKRETEDSKDSRTDNDNFLIVVRRDGTDWVAAKDEGFASVTGVISPETAYNLSITPARILRTHGAHLRSFLNKQQAEQIIARFSEGNNGLVTQLTGGDSVAENGSVVVADLPQPVYLAEVYTFRKKLTRAELTALQNDPYGYISFSETNQNHQRMFLLEAVRDAESKEVRFQGLRANV